MDYSGYLNNEGNPFLAAYLESQPQMQAFPQFHHLAQMQIPLAQLAAMGIRLDPHQLHALAANAAVVNAAAANAAAVNAAVNGGFPMFLPSQFNLPYTTNPNPPIPAHLLPVATQSTNPILEISTKRERSNRDERSNKKRRTNYRRPENAAKLNAAVNALIMQKQDRNGHGDIRTVSKLFNIPYNTLRDNYLR